MSLSISQYVGGIVTAIFNPAALQDDEPGTPGGPEAIEQAMDELNGLSNKDFDATLGTPDIVEDDEADFFGDPKVVIPIEDAPYEGVNRLVFDLPAGTDDAYAELSRLMDAVEVESIADLEGMEVPVGFFGGNAAVLWDELFGPTDTPKGTEENPYTEDDIEQADQMMAEDEGNQLSTETGTPDSSETAVPSDDESDDAADSGTVNVEETNVSPDSAASSDDDTAEDDGSM